MMPAPRPSVFPLSVSMSRAELMKGVVDGTPQARAALFDEFSSLVLRVLTRTLGRREERHDALHDVFLYAFAHAAAVRDPEALRSWLLSITIFHARRVLRTQRRWRWLEFRAPEDVPEASSAGLDSPAQVMRAVYRLLQRVSADEQLAFSLRYIEGMTVEEVAQAMDLSVSTVKRRLGTATAYVREQAQRDPVLEPWVKGLS
jgi:RNA polymerase sigma-70 factor, ECF subfamily